MVKLLPIHAVCSPLIRGQQGTQGSRELYLRSIIFQIMILLALNTYITNSVFLQIYLALCCDAARFTWEVEPGYGGGGSSSSKIESAGVWFAVNVSWWSISCCHESHTVGFILRLRIWRWRCAWLITTGGISSWGARLLLRSRTCSSRL